MSEFNPNDHLTKLKGVPYLEVKWRMAWLRDKHPDAVIETDMVSMNDTHAIFKATVSIPGGGSATGWGSETPGDFRDYIEKAETKALGRALAALGFGTQFAPDVDDGSAHDRPVDAPVARSEAPGRDERPRIANPTASASDKQIGLIKGLAHQKGISRERLEARCSQLYTKPLDQLTKAEASDLIDRLNAVPDAGHQSGDNDTGNDSDYDPVAMFNEAHPNPMFS